MLDAARPRRLRTTLITVTATLVAGLVVSGLAVVATPTAASAQATPTCSAAGITVAGLGGPNFYIDSGSSPSFRSAYTGYRITNATGAALGDVWAQLSNFTGGSLGLASGQSAAQRVGDLADGAGGSRFWYLTASGVSATAQNHTITLYSHNPSLPDATPLCTATGGFSSVQGTLDAAANKVTGITVSGGTPKLGSQFTVTVTGDTGTIGAGITGDSQSLWMSPAVTENWPADAFRLVGTSLTISPDGTAPAQTYTDILRLAGLGSTARSYTASYTFRAIGFTSSSTTVKPVQEIASGTQVKHTGNYSVALPAIPAPTNDLSFALSSSPDKVDLGGGDVDLTGPVSGTAGAELDALVLTLPSCASVRAGTATWNGQPIAEPVASGGDLVFSGPFVVGGTGLQLGLHLGSAPGLCRVQLLGAVGTARIGATSSPIDGSNPATVDVDVDTAPTMSDRTVMVLPGTQVTLDVSGQVTDADGDAWDITGTGQPGQGGVTVDGRTVTYTPSDPEYVGQDSFTVTVDDHRGGTATATITVQLDPNAPAPAPQSIDFAQPGDLVVGDTGTLQASASSGLTVGFASQTPAVCTVSGDQVTAVADGSCTVEATQPGDATYAAADPVTRTLTITTPQPVAVASPVAQTIDFAQPADLVIGDTGTLQASASSGLSVTFASQTPAVCTVSGDQVTAVAAGSCTVEATQPGDATYAAADPVTRTLTVATQPQTITFAPPATVLGLDPLTLDGQASSGLPVGYAVTAGDCTVTGTSLTPASAGTCTVEATQDGDTTRAAADPVSADVTFVEPTDDTAATAGNTAVDVDVTANDPAGVALAAAGTPAHGSATLVGGRVRYTPATGFHGSDSFGYTVSDGAGRTAQARVDVVVGNLAPRVAGAAVAQLAGTSYSLVLDASDADSDPVTVTAVSSRPTVTAQVLGSVLTLSASPAASGRVTVNVTVTDTAGATASALVTTLVTPIAPDAVARRLSTRGTDVSWQPAPTADARYEVLVDGRVACTTTRTSCHLADLAGPARKVTVRTLGRDDTRSGERAATLTGHGAVLITTVYFDSGSAALSKADRRTLQSAVRVIRTSGFARTRLDGYTDADGGLAFNMALSHRRTSAVAAYLRGHGDITSTQTWHGEFDPVASNAVAQGKARNRRVEVLVRY